MPILKLICVSKSVQRVNLTQDGITLFKARFYTLQERFFSIFIHVLSID